MPFQRVIKNYLVQAGHSPSSIPVEEWTAKGKLRGRLHIGYNLLALLLAFKCQCLSSLAGFKK